MSWQLAAILFAFFAFEGVRRLEPEDLVIRCDPLGVWRVASPVRLWRDWHLVSVLSPFFLTIVIRPDVPASAVISEAGDIRAFAKSIEPILALRLLGAIDFLVMVPGIPWGVARHGSTGLFALLGIALTLSATIALRSQVALSRQGEPRKAVFRRAISFLSPFASPFAAEAVLSAGAQRRSRISVIEALLGAPRFHAVIRRAAYDAESRAPVISGSSLQEIALALPRSERARILKSAADGCTDRERFCPRCAEKYSLASSFCADCDGIALRLA